MRIVANYAFVKYRARAYELRAALLTPDIMRSISIAIWRVHARGRVSCRISSYLHLKGCVDLDSSRYIRCTDTLTYYYILI